MKRAKFLSETRPPLALSTPTSDKFHPIHSQTVIPSAPAETRTRTIMFSFTETLMISCLILLAQQLVDPTLGQSAGPTLHIVPAGPVQTKSIEEGASLMCKAQGGEPSAFSLRWESSKYSFEELKRRYSISDSEPGTLSLDIDRPTLDDRDNYTCIGTHQSNDQLKSTVEVTFYNPIKFTNCPERQFLIDGEKTRSIYCEFTSDQPMIELKKDGVKINTNTKYKWNNKDTIELESNAEPSDAGTYTIIVFNQLGGVRKVKNIFVSVLQKPLILPHPEGGFHSVEGEQVLLECKATGIPQPLISWSSPQSKNLTFEGGYINAPEKGTLLIQHVNKEKDVGPFTCRAWNDAGQVERTFQMNVDTRPRIVQFTNKTVDENKEVDFECRAIGEPKPDFSLRRQGLNQRPYTPGDGFLIDQNTEAEGGGSNVWVYRAKVRANRSHFGQIYCNATNRAGTAEEAAELAVNFKPDLSGTSVDQYVRLGKQIAVTCHIRAYPKPIVSWFVDNTQMVNITSNMKEGSDKQVYIVTMMPAQPIASGRFVCRAQNLAGQSEQVIIPRYSQAPGPVQASLVDVRPTTVNLLLSVPNDGGDRIRTFRYTAEGRTLDFNNPLYTYRVDRQNESVIDAQLSPRATYTIKNLLPNYSYKIFIRAVNEVGAGDMTEVHVDTLKPTKPSAPHIIKPNVDSTSTRGVTSDYSNGYVLKWSPPDLDNGDPITKYIIKIIELRGDPLGTTADVGEPRVIEKVSDKSTYAHLGPMISGLRYRIELQARNNIGDSEAAHLLVNVPLDKPSLPEFEAQTMAWLTESPTTLVAVLTGFAVLLILIDLVSCFCCQIGLSYYLRNKCCPQKSNSVVADKIMDA